MSRKLSRAAPGYALARTVAMMLVLGVSSTPALSGFGPGEGLGGGAEEVLYIGTLACGEGRAAFFDEFGLKVTRCISACGSVHILKVTVCTNAHEESACQWSEPRSIRNPGSTSFGSLTVHAACPLGGLACDISVHGSARAAGGQNAAYEISK